MPAGNVVVLGGSGFIGQKLVAALLDEGFAVRVVSRRVASGNGGQPGLENVRADVADSAAMTRVTAGSDAVFHLATGGGDRWAEFERDFVQGAEYVASACHANHVPRLIYTSSIAALYLGKRGTFTESMDVDAGGPGRSMYSRGKIQAEQVLQSLHRTQGLPVVILRPGLVVGEGGMLNHGGVGYWPNDTCCIGWSRGTTPLPFVLVRDVVAALIAAMKVPGIEGQTFNLVGEVRPSAVEYVRMVAGSAHRNFRFYPQSTLKLQLTDIGKWILKAMARKPENPFPSFHDLKSRTLVSQLDCSAAKRHLGWRPTADRDVFVREAIDVHLKPIPPGDLRLAATP